MGCAVCDETQNLNETGSETFFRYQIFSRPVPRLFSVPNFFETGSETFFGTKFFRDRFRDFFRYQIFSRPVPRLQKNKEIPGNGTGPIPRPKPKPKSTPILEKPFFWQLSSSSSSSEAEEVEVD